MVILNTMWTFFQIVDLSRRPLDIRDARLLHRRKQPSPCSRHSSTRNGPKTCHTHAEIPLSETIFLATRPCKRGTSSIVDFRHQGIHCHAAHFTSDLKFPVSHSLCSFSPRIANLLGIPLAPCNHAHTAAIAGAKRLVRGFEILRTSVLVPNCP
jgi:hypothetical protein